MTTVVNETNSCRFTCVEMHIPLYVLTCLSIVTEIVHFSLETFALHVVFDMYNIKYCFGNLLCAVCSLVCGEIKSVQMQTP